MVGIFLSIVIPCYNEGDRIVFTLNKIINYLNKKINYEIILIDDGSYDNTKAKIQEICRENQGVSIKLLINDKNYGKGFSIKKGVMVSCGDYIYFTDADLSTPIEEIEKFLKYIDKYDIVIGSRGVKDSKILIHQPIYREIAGKLFNKILKLILGLHYNDTQCGSKLFKNEIAKFIFSKLTINKFSFDVEVLYIAKKYGYKVIEIPIIWKHSKGSKVKFLKDGLNMIFDLIRIKINDCRKLYD